ncbi:NACHT, LRR and PYD domains-containing protein 12-like protein, partial [Lates japonicus]
MKTSNLWWITVTLVFSLPAPSSAAVDQNKLVGLIKAIKAMKDGFGITAMYSVAVSLPKDHCQESSVKECRMGNWLTTVQAVDPLTSAIPQKQAGTKRVAAQNGGVIINPKFNGADVKGDVNINVNMNVQSPAKTDKTDIVSHKTKENTIQ